MWRREFWIAAAERAVKSAAQAPLVVWGVGDVALNVLTVDWKLGLGVAGGAALASVLTSLASVEVGPTSSPSLVGETDRN